MENGQPEARMSPLFKCVWLASLLFIATWLRVHNADFFYYSPDEAMHIGMAEGKDVSEVWQFSGYETHPPLGNIMRHFWLFVSHDVGFVRGQSLFFGLALILLYYRIGLKTGGEPAAVACASLAAFGHGGIIQSYVARNYMFLVFFLSLAFYAYLHWRESRKAVPLLAYVICGCLAALTHFSAVFSIACIAVFEALRLLIRKDERQALPLWIAANAAVAVVAIGVYYQWQPILAPIREFYFTPHALPVSALLADTLRYPQAAAAYLFPSPASGTVILIAMVVCGMMCGSTRPLLGLAIAGLILGMALVFTGLYNTLGTRYCLWLFPLVIPAAGMTIANIGTCTLRKLMSNSSHIGSTLLAAFLLVAGAAFYNVDKRFGDGSEYAMPQQQWDDLNNFLQTLGPDSLIVTEKDDGIMLANLYPLMGKDAFTGKKMATLAPYRGTHILFNPYYPRHYSTGILLAAMEDAQTRHLLNGINRIVFLEMAWSRSPQADLMLCDALAGKQLVTFPPLPTDRALTRDDIYRTRAALLLMPTQTFLNDVLPAAGKAHGCLNGLHDMSPGFIPKP
jgi:uncharacterized membrane protein